MRRGALDLSRHDSMIPAVGILSALTMRRSQTDLQAAMNVATGLTDPATLPIASPWSDSTLERIVFSDIFGGDYAAGIHTRAGAMRVPAIARGRNLLCSTIGRLPLRSAQRGTPLERQPSWLTSSEDGTTPQHRLVWTVDDLIFYGWSCWARTNDSASRFPLSVRRVNQGDWRVNDDNRVEINGIVQRDEDVILIPGFHEGILSFGRDALSDARTLREIVADRLANPVPQVELHQTGGKAMNKTERAEVIEEWRAARKAPGGTVGYTNEHIELKTHGAEADGSLMVDARNAASLDLARVIGVSAGMLDATAPKASLNYETQTGRNQEFVDFDLALYMTPITARLSLDDVTPHGTHTVFDLTDYTAPAPSPTGPALED